MNAAVKNAGYALTGDSNRTQQSQGMFYNADVAELALQDETQMILDRLYFINQSVTSTQDIGVAVCSGANYWNAPIANEFFGVVTMDGTKGNAPVNLNSIGGPSIANGEISMYGKTSLVAGSQFIANNDKLFTVKNVYSNKILVNGAVSMTDLAISYGTIATLANQSTAGVEGYSDATQSSNLQFGTNITQFAMTFDKSQPFGIEINSVFQFDTPADGGNLTILAAVVAVVGADVVFNVLTPTYPTGTQPGNIIINVGPINSNSEHNYFTPSADYFTPATPGIVADPDATPPIIGVAPTVDSFIVPAGTTTLKVETGFNFPVGSTLDLELSMDRGTAGNFYGGVTNNTFPTEATDANTDAYQIVAVDALNNTITLDQPLAVMINIATTTPVLTDVVTVATALRGINMYSSVYDPSVIVQNLQNVTDAATGLPMSVMAQSLVTFSKLLDYQPNWVNDEFLTVVLKKNASGLYAIVENWLASYKSTARDVQNRNMFANEVFFYNSNFVYCKVNEDATLPKVNTAEGALVEFMSDFGQMNITSGEFVYGTVYPLVNDASTGLPTVNAGAATADNLQGYAYTPNGYTQGDVQFAQQAFADSEVFDVNILIAHQLDINGMSTISETRNDCITVVAPYDYVTIVGKTPTLATSVMLEGYGAQTVSQNQIFNAWGTYSAVYGNMKYQYDKFNDVNRWMCVAGDIAGLYAQTDANRDPWWAPAGLDRGKITNAIKLAFNPNKQNRDDLYVNSINPIITIVGEGAAIVYGQKTATATPSAIDRINVRRLLIVIEKAIATAVKSALFEFNDSFTRSRLVGIVEPFLRTVKSRRGLYDYLVVCDDSNNPASVLDANALVIDVYVKPTKVAEFITINMNITRSDANFQELVGMSA
jgi:phage tail sheath protein FI